MVTSRVVRVWILTKHAQHDWTLFSTISSIPGNHTFSLKSDLVFTIFGDLRGQGLLRALVAFWEQLFSFRKEYWRIHTDCYLVFPLTFCHAAKSAASTPDCLVPSYQLAVTIVLDTACNVTSALVASSSSETVSALVVEVMAI